jgi:hypothetical protein
MISAWGGGVLGQATQYEGQARRKSGYDRQGVRWDQVEGGEEMAKGRSMQKEKKKPKQKKK